MEDSFNVRVGKIFGSLNSSSAASSSSLSSSLWRLTDDEVERRHWSREKSTPELQEDLQDIDDEDEDEDEDEVKDDEPESKNVDSDWDIKASIGLDCTLDYEEEEDEYDKLAVGNDKPEDRVYMRDVQDYGIDIDLRFQIPVSLEEADRDPRANHLAAKIRLKEDSDAADLNPKSILKRKDNHVSDSTKSSKRVRFDPDCVDHQQARCGGGDHERDRNSASAVPDYMLNPSRYTRYTFDSCSSDDVDDNSNKHAYMDFLKTLNKSVADADASFDPAKPVTFIPRKKTTGNTSAMVDSCTELVQRVGIGKDAQRRIAAGDGQVCGMEEDEPPQSMPSRRADRQYRVKPRPEFND